MCVLKSVSKKINLSHDETIEWNVLIAFLENHSISLMNFVPHSKKKYNQFNIFLDAFYMKIIFMTFLCVPAKCRDVKCGEIHFNLWHIG
jgi:hypothetical protein